MPFAGLLCLGLSAFALAATIVLALIPLYLPKKDVPPVTPFNATGNKETMKFDDNWFLRIFC